LFKGVQALKVRFTQCSDAKVSGDMATISCTQNISNTVGGKVRPLPPFPADISLKKTNGTWVITDLAGH
jgi:hypothetical protein